MRTLGKKGAPRLLVLAVGKIKEPGLRDAVDDYTRRIDHHFGIEVVEVRDAAENELTAALATRMPASSHNVALDAGGKSMTSAAFAHWLEARTREGKGKVVFIIGGPEGIPPRIRERAHETLSLSPMTLPHRLARLVLVEQLYRAGTILRGEPYARL